jgi:glycerol-3-phosphate dehydrogenase
MKRRIHKLSDKVYDVAIIGGGVYGASVAREAALRGLTVVLVDQADFGSATSANSQRIVHGGLRYLQHGDFRRMRESIYERSTWLRIAPHLVFPMAVLVPTYKRPVHEKSVMAIALKLNDMIGFDRNRHLEPEKKIPSGRMLSQSECLEYCPDLQKKHLSGAALFFDAQAHNTERLTLSLLVSAVASGAVVVNYARVIRFMTKSKAIQSMAVEDVGSGRVVNVRAKKFVNCSGPWTAGILEMAGMVEAPKKRNWIKAVLLLTRQLVKNVALGVKGRSKYRNSDAIIDKGHRYFFITPWEQNSLIGTLEVPYNGEPSEFQVTEDDICSFIEEINLAYPAGCLTRSDVKRVYGGLVPANESDSRDSAASTKHYSIEDHSLENGVEGLISVTGIKYTTARHIAEKAIDLVEQKLGKPQTMSLSSVIPVCGGAMKSFDQFLNDELTRRPQGLSDETIRHLIHIYGSEYPKILRYCEQDSEWAEPVCRDSPAIRAQILHAVREEMACRLEDILYRRTELGATGNPDDAAVNTCADIMARELTFLGRPSQPTLLDPYNSTPRQL